MGLKLPNLLGSFKYITPTCGLKIHWAANEVQRQCSACVCVETHSHSTHSRRVFISDSQGMIGICRYVFCTTFMNHPHDTPGCSLYPIQAYYEHPQPLLFQTHTWTATDTQILPQAAVLTPPVIGKSGHHPPKSWQNTVDITTSCCEYRICVFAY